MVMCLCHHFSFLLIIKTMKQFFSSVQVLELSPSEKKYNIVNHIDENRKNNKVENLEWCNNKQNITHNSLTIFSHMELLSCVRYDNQDNLECVKYV